MMLQTRSFGMEFTCVLPDEEGTIIRFYRNSFFGSVSIKANGQVVYSRSALNPSIHFESALTREYEFSLPGATPRHVCITKVRPLVLAGVRTNRYDVAYNGQNIGSYAG